MPGCGPFLRCVRLALADLRVGQWGEAISIPSRQPAGALRMRGLAGPQIFPGWSVGRARLTLNQD